MASVVETEELVSIILGKLDSRRDLAFCSMVSSLWHRCSTIAQQKMLYFALLEHDEGLLLLDSSTHTEEAADRYTFENTRNPDLFIIPGPYRDFLLLAGCHGLLLLTHKTEKQLILWNPILFKLLELPPPEIQPVAAALIRDEPECNGEILLLIMDRAGRLDRFDFQKRGWVQETPGLGSSEVSFFGVNVNRQLFYNRGGLMVCFSCPERDEVKIFRFSLREREWSEVAIANEETLGIGEPMRPLQVEFMAWNGGRVLFIVILEWFEFFCFELEQGRFVRQPWLEDTMNDTMNGIQSLEDDLPEDEEADECVLFNVHGEDMFWMYGRRDVAEVIMYGVLKLSLGNMNKVELRMPRESRFETREALSFFTCDKGEAFSQFEDPQGEKEDPGEGVVPRKRKRD